MNTIPTCLRRTAIAQFRSGLVMLSLSLPVGPVSAQDGPRAEGLRRAPICTNARTEDQGDSASLNLLKKINLEKDVVFGRWDFLPAGPLMVTPAPAGQESSRLMLLGSAPEEYEVTLKVERMEGPGPNMSLIFPVGKGQAALIVDGFTEGGYWSGLDALDGKPAYRHNETLRKGQRLLVKEPALLVLTVRRDRVTFTCDGKSVIDWQGDPTRLSVPANWKAPKTNALILGAHATFLFHEIKLKSLSVAPIAAPVTTRKAELPGVGELMYEGPITPDKAGSQALNFFALMNNGGEVSAYTGAKVLATVSSSGKRTQRSPGTPEAFYATSDTELDIPALHQRFKLAQMDGKLQNYVQHTKHLFFHAIGKENPKTNLIDVRYILMEEEKPTAPSKTTGKPKKDAGRK